MERWRYQRRPHRFSSRYNTITVTDAVGCIETATFTVTEPAVLGMNGTPTDVTTNGGSDGSIDVTATGGTTPYTYLWNDGDTNEDRSNLTSGTYTVTVTDANGCTEEAIFTINEPGCNEVVSGVVIDVLCNVGTDASIDVTVTGNNGTVTYLWNDGDTNEDRTGLSAGTYTVTATDAAGCIETATFTVTEPALLGMNGTPTDVTTNGGSDGSIDVTATGGTPAYTYLWNDGDTNEDRTNLTSGTYTVTVTDANGCTEEATFTVNEPGCNEVVSGVVIDVLCNGGTDASIDVTVTGNNGAVTYLWNDGDTNEDRTGLAAGTYTVTATDAAGCIETATFTVTEPALLGMNGTPTDVTTNGGSDGSIDVTATGGTPAYTYLWNDGDTNEDRTNLTSGTYTVTVTDANGCTEEATFTVNEPGCNEVVSGVVIDVLCNGGTDASIDVTVTGNNGAVTYLWNDGDTNEDRTGLAAGTYTVTATDAVGCIETATFTVTEPALLGMNGTPTDVTTNGGSDGSIDVTATGGTPAYAYVWNDGDTNEDRTNLTSGTYIVTVTDANGCTAEVTFTINEPGCSMNLSGFTVDVVCNGGADASIDLTVTGANGATTYLWSDGDTNEDRTGIAAGTYTVTATDATGCIETATFTVTEPAILGMTGTPTDVTTNGGSDGSIDVTATGGTPFYTYLWNDSDTNEDRSNLIAGTYTVTVTDANGCTEEVTFSINEPVCSMSLSGITVDIVCNGGANASIDLTVTGASGATTYLWSDGDTNEDRTGLMAGTYTVTVSDAANCVETTTFTITEPTVLGMNGTPTDVTTNGGSDGSIDVTATGGTPFYTYLWNDSDTNEDRSNLIAGTYTVTVTDANGCTEEATFSINEPGCSMSLSGITVDIVCNGGAYASIDLTVTGASGATTYLWSDGDTNEDRTGLMAGTYTVTVTDAANCVETTTFTITEPTVLGMNGTPTDVTTNGGSDGSIDVTATGGTPFYTYLWNDSDTNEDRSNLIAGTYTVTVTDANGCTEEVTFSINEPGCSMSLSGITVDIVCNGGANASIDLTVTGASGATTYLWSDGDTNEDRTGLMAGTYTVTVTDAANCVETTTFTITEPTVLGMNGTPTDVTTNGGSDGSIDVTATGGTPVYTYLWNDGDTNEDRSNLIAGTYTVTVTDANGCNAEIVIVVNQPGCKLMSSISKTNVSCYGASNGTATVSASGGLIPYTYAWSNGATTSSISGLTPGFYNVIVTDAAGCTSKSVICIFDGAKITINIASSASICGACNGTAIANVSGGKSPYAYLWSNGSTSLSTGSLCSGTYTLTITDSKGCTNVSSVKIDDEGELIDCTISKTNVNCYGGSNGSAAVNVTGGTGPYTYLWNNGATTATITSLSAGNYTVTVWSTKGCSTECSVKVGQPKSAVTSSALATNSTCGACNGTAVVNAAGGNSPYTYLWSNGQTTMTATGLCAGYYDVTVTDARGCTSMSTVKVDDISQALTCSVTKTNVSCQGGNDGSATVVVIGGTAPYTYAWSNGATTATIGGLSAGTYTVTVWSAAGCSTECSIKIGQPKSVVTCNATATNATCGGCNGTATATATGGKAPYTYLWSNGQTTMTATGLCAGNYDVTVTDSKGCSSNCTVKVDDAGSTMSASATSTNALCGACNGTATVSVSGGTMPYSYAWNNGQTGATATGLCGGNYSVVVTDANGCTAAATVKVDDKNATIVMFYRKHYPTCNGGNDGGATIKPSGGTAPYTYLWSNGSTTKHQPTLSAGIYTVTVTDANGCSASTTIKIGQPAALVAVGKGKDATCKGCDGKAKVLVDGGREPYTYLWSNGATTDVVANVCAGTYVVTVTDAGGCQTMATVVINGGQASISASISKTHSISCRGGNDGELTATATGGSAPYTYAWSNGQSGAIATNLTAGIYTVTATDANGCTGTASFSLTQPQKLVAIIGNSTNAACGLCNGTASVSASGGTAPYSYLWSNGSTSDQISSLCAGTYTVTVTDGKGCDVNTMVTITDVQDEVKAIIQVVAPVSCHGAEDGSLKAKPTSGTGPFTFLWSNGATTQVIGNLKAGKYTVTVTSAYGCTAQVMYTLVNPKDPCDKIKTAMEGEALLSKFNVYPNPTLGRFVVSFNAKQSTYYSIDIKRHQW
ncbi:MAG: SprB repeat-containing protein [Bacteroidetes bacterium]|nr:SprB repeat-containing protein [Bacteroidota bacterium]